MRIVRRFSDALLSPIAVALAALSLGYGLFARLAFSAGDTASTPINAADHVFAVLSGTQLLVMVLLPLWLGVVLVGVARLVDEPERLLRHGSRLRALRAGLVTEVSLLLTGATIVVAAAVVTSAGLPMELGWSAATLLGALTDTPYEAASAIRFAVDIPPLVALGFSVLVPACMLAVVGVIVIAIRLLTGRNWPAVVAAVFMWVWAAWGAVDVFALGALLSLGNYLSFAASIADGLIAWRILAVLGAIVLVVVVVAARDRRTFSGATRRAGISWVGGATLLVLAALVLGMTSGATDSAEAAAFSLFSGTAGTALATGFTLLVLFGFTGVLSSWFGERLGGFGLFELIRIGTPVRWLWRMLGRMTVWTAAYTALVVGGTSAVYLLMGGVVGDVGDDMLVLAFLLLLTALQLVFLNVVVTGTFLITGSRAAVLLVLIVLIVLNLVPTPGEVAPFALSLADVPMTADLIVRRSLTLTVWIVAALAALVVTIRFRGIRSLE